MEDFSTESNMKTLFRSEYYLEYFFRSMFSCMRHDLRIKRLQWQKILDVGDAALLKTQKTDDCHAVAIIRPNQGGFNFRLQVARQR
jgi:hypothetical protein